jgi:hypothetical protein
MTMNDRRKGALVPIHPDNVHTRDWVILLEASTIVGQTRDKLRVAMTTQERKIVRKRKLFGKTTYFLVVDGYDPRIHALYFCPQLYRNESGTLVPLTGPEMGQLMAQALEGGAVEKSPWYEPSEDLPEEPVIKPNPKMELDSLVVDAPRMTTTHGGEPASMSSDVVAKPSSAKAEKSRPTEVVRSN